jgi:hypothetical protein
MLTKLLPRSLVSILAPEPMLPLYKDTTTINREQQTSLLTSIQNKLKEVIIDKFEAPKKQPTRKASIV